MSHKQINGYLIHLKEIIAKGSRSIIYKAEQDKTKKLCAAKILEKKVIDNNLQFKLSLLFQLNILQAVRSQNIVKILCATESTNNYYIIQQLCDTNLQKLINQNKFLDEQKAINILQQICNGFIDLFKVKRIIHRNLKPKNIMLDNGIVKIGCFGSALIDKNQQISKIKQQQYIMIRFSNYQSLQILKSQPYTSKCDIWSIGLIFYELLHGKRPWTAQTTSKLISHIQTQQLIINPDLSQNTKDLIGKMFINKRRKQDQLG